MIWRIQALLPLQEWTQVIPNTVMHLIMHSAMQDVKATTLTEHIIQIIAARAKCVRHWLVLTAVVKWQEVICALALGAVK